MSLEVELTGRGLSGWGLEGKKAGSRSSFLEKEVLRRAAAKGEAPRP